MADTNQKSMVTDLTKGSVFSNLVRLALPFMLSNLLQMLYSMIDMIVVGQYVGSTGLSAVKEPLIKSRLTALHASRLHMFPS